MALTLSKNFTDDIAGSHTNLIPVIKIGNEGIAPEDYIYLSTTKINITHEDIYTPDVFPALLNISSFREAIDLEEGRYKISNCSLSISNLKYNNLIKDLTSFFMY